MFTKLKHSVGFLSQDLKLVFILNLPFVLGGLKIVQSIKPCVLLSSKRVSVFFSRATLSSNAKS